MFYLKYRPKTLDEIDNSAIKEQVTKILKSERIPHAFLFVGPKGTGKTSTARILAKTINCLENKFAKSGKSLEPCNKCKNCLGIDSSSSVDVVELDAASNRGIEEIRGLIREASFLPMTNRYRVFIIDEAHMITPDAFNALLKTLEEPPQSVVFILATTHGEKIPRTIASRCFSLNFGKAKTVDIKHMLKRVAKAEHVSVDEELLNLIAKHSDNSFRDGAKLLEELSVQKKLTLNEGKKFLGIFSKASLLEIIQKKELKEALLWIEEFAQAGGSFKHLLEQLLEDLRIILLTKNKIETDEEEIPLDYSLSEISHLIRLFTEAYNNLKISPIDSLPLEIAIVDFYNSRSVKNS